MGSDCSSSAVSFQMADKVRPLGQKMKALRDAGQDPKDVDLTGPGKYAKTKSCPPGHALSSLAYKCTSLNRITTITRSWIDVEKQRSHAGYLTAHHARWRAI